MSKKKLPKVVIAIAAYNAEGRIGLLLRALAKQHYSSVRLDTILVYSDNSTDKTVSRAKKLSQKLAAPIQVVAGEKRGGYGYAIQRILSLSCADITVLLNDDIVIKDNLLIEKLCTPFLSDQSLGLVCGNPLPLPATNFIQRAIASSFYSYLRMASHKNNGNSIFTCDGKIMAISKGLQEKFIFPKDLRDLGNVDAYFYFMCKRKRYTYRYVPTAIAYYKNPTKIAELTKWFIRNNANPKILEKTFGNVPKKEYKLSWGWLIFYSAIEACKNPLGCLLLAFLHSYIAIQARLYAMEFKSTWEVIETTKHFS